ncbi:hypothetical protein CRX72_17595 [Pantoea sp. BRM17]|nr:hypothetical protein CRX72_17595 [Pantoea sp. BRM17]
MPRYYSLADNDLRANKQVMLGGCGYTFKSLQYSPYSYWFANVTLRAPITDFDRYTTDFRYSFGYDDWHANTFSLVYSNYGDNHLFPSGTKRFTYWAGAESSEPIQAGVFTSRWGRLFSGNKDTFSGALSFSSGLKEQWLTIPNGSESAQQKKKINQLLNLRVTPLSIWAHSACCGGWLKKRLAGVLFLIDRRYQMEFGQRTGITCGVIMLVAGTLDASAAETGSDKIGSSTTSA